MDDFDEQEQGKGTGSAAGGESEHILEDTFELEISDLPPTTESHYALLRLKALKQRLRLSFSTRSRAISPVSQRNATLRRTARLRVGRTLTALGLCAALLVLLLGNVPSLRSRLFGLFQTASVTPTATSAPTLSANSLIVVHGRSLDLPPPKNMFGISLFGSLPTTCPVSSELVNFPQSFGVPVLPVGPFWAMGFAGPSAALIQLQPAFSTTDTVFAWYAPVTLFIPTAYSGDITLAGDSQIAGAALSFGNPGAAHPTRSVTLNPLKPGPGQHYTSTGGLESITLNIFVPEAGCYFLGASWSDGTFWIAYFAAGLQP